MLVFNWIKILQILALTNRIVLILVNYIIKGESNSSMHKNKFFELYLITFYVALWPTVTHSMATIQSNKIKQIKTYHENVIISNS